MYVSHVDDVRAGACRGVKVFHSDNILTRLSKSKI